MRRVTRASLPQYSSGCSMTAATMLLDEGDNIGLKIDRVMRKRAQ